jgi:lipopolysaccharide export system protein LptA
VIRSRFPILPCVLLLTALTLRSDNAPVDDESTLTADHFEWEQKEGLVHYWGHIHLNAPGLLDLTCDDLLAYKGETGAGFNRIEASTNVVINMVQQPATSGTASPVVRPGTTNVAHGFKAVFNATNNVVTLLGSPETGQPRVENQDLTAVADTLIFDRANGRFSGHGHFTNWIRATALKRTAKPSAPPQ